MIDHVLACRPGPRRQPHRPRQRTPSAGTHPERPPAPHPGRPARWHHPGHSGRPMAKWLTSTDRPAPTTTQRLATETEPPRSTACRWPRSDGTGQRDRYQPAGPGARLSCARDTEALPARLRHWADAATRLRRRAPWPARSSAPGLVIFPGRACPFDRVLAAFATCHPGFLAWPCWRGRARDVGLCRRRRRGREGGDGNT